MSLETLADESEEESEETDSSDGEPFEEVVPSALPRSAPTPTPLVLASSPTPVDGMSLAPPDDGTRTCCSSIELGCDLAKIERSDHFSGASSAKSVSPPSSSTSSSTQPSVRCCRHALIARNCRGCCLLGQGLPLASAFNILSFWFPPATKQLCQVPQSISQHLAKRQR
jgi:hypothetical protein